MSIRYLFVKYYDEFQRHTEILFRKFLKYYKMVGYHCFMQKQEQAQVFFLQIVYLKHGQDQRDYFQTTLALGILLDAWSQI